MKIFNMETFKDANASTVINSFFIVVILIISIISAIQDSLSIREINEEVMLLKEEVRIQNYQNRLEIIEKDIEELER